MSKVYLINNGNVQEFEDIHAAQQYMNENGIHVDQVITTEQCHKPEMPKSIESYMDKIYIEPRLNYTPKSGQDNRRERRAKERELKKRK